MKNVLSKALLAVCLAYCVTGSSAFFGRIKFLDIRHFFKAIPMPITIVPPHPKITPTTTKTAPPPTTIPTTLPPTTNPPTTIHPDDITIALCNEAMSECPWTSEELVEKIIARQQVDTNVEYNGEGESVGPMINPSKVGDKLEQKIAGTKSPGFAPKQKGTRGRNNRVPKKCLPFGKKYRNPAEYAINCVKYIIDSTIPKYNQRRNAMIGCFKCRYLCELGGYVAYL